MTIVHESRRASRAVCGPQRRTQAPPTRARCVPLRDPPKVPRPSRSGSTNPPPTRRGARFSSGFRSPSLIEKGIPNRRPRVADPPFRSRSATQTPQAPWARPRRKSRWTTTMRSSRSARWSSKVRRLPVPSGRILGRSNRRNALRSGVKNAILPNFPRRVYSYDIVPSLPRPSETDLGGSLPLPTRQTRRRRSSPRATPSRRRRRTTRR